MTSSIEEPSASSIRTRTPFVDGSIAGDTGTVMVPLNRIFSRPGTLSREKRILGFTANTGTMLVQGSQASPMPSWSLSAWAESAVVGQSSSASQTPSPSVSGLPVSAGQLASEPVQTSGRSQPVLAPRQTVPAATSPSGGQSLPTPSQFSSTSQMPAAARQTAVLLASAGQSTLEPSQSSSRSQTPAARRQGVPATVTSSAGQSSAPPSQVSSTSQTPAAARHTAVLLASAGQSTLVPSQSSSRSQTPAARGQGVPATATSSAGQSAAPPSKLSATSQTPAAARPTAGRLAPGGR